MLPSPVPVVASSTSRADGRPSAAAAACYSCRLLNDDGKVKLARLEAEMGRKNGRLPATFKAGDTAAKDKDKDKDCCVS